MPIGQNSQLGLQDKSGVQTLLLRVKPVWHLKHVFPTHSEHGVRHFYLQSNFPVES